ncbi:MAG: hypothetical protein ACK4K9_06735 [Bacteroidia bacterium]
MLPAHSTLNLLRFKIIRSASIFLQLIVFMLMVVMLNACKRDMSIKTQEINKVKQNPQFQTQSFSEEQITADAILTVITALNGLTQAEFCTARTILYDEEMSVEAKLSSLNEISTNGEKLVNTLYEANSILSNVTSFMDLNFNGGYNSFTDDVIDIMLYNSDVIWNNAPQKPDCTAYNAQVKAIGNAWLMQTAFCVSQGSLVCIAIASKAALDQLAANDAAYPACANGGNQQGMPLQFWWYLISQTQDTVVCNNQN